MSTSPRWFRKALYVAALVTLLLPVSCSSSSSSGGGGGGNPLVNASFATADAAAAANLIRMIQSVVSGNSVTIQIAIGGATTSTDFYGFAFDILLSSNTAGAALLGGSATAGPFLDCTGCSSGILVSAVQNGDRVIVGINKSGAVAGNGLASGEAVVIELTFTVSSTGSATLTFSGPTNVPPGCSSGSAEAIDSAGNCITTENFGAGGTITGS